MAITGKTHKTGNPSGSVPVRRAWEPMCLTRVGAFGDVLRGSTGSMMDTGGLKLP